MQTGGKEHVGWSRHSGVFGARIFFGTPEPEWKNLMIEATAARVVEKLIATHLELESPEGPIMNEIQRVMLADLVEEDLSSAGVNRRRKPAAKDRH